MKHHLLYAAAIIIGLAALALVAKASSLVHSATPAHAKELGEQKIIKQVNAAPG